MVLGLGVAMGTPGEVDYRLERRRLVSEFRKGRLGRTEVCDAHPELVRAARNVGRPTGQRCPICEDADLVHVSYVFGARMPPSGRCVATDAELAKVRRGAGDLACYVVEVCPDCSWNHLARAYPLPPAARRRSATAR